MNKCENCGQEHDGTFSSGRFCSKNCSRSFSTKGLNKETKIVNCVSCNKSIEVLKRSRSKNVNCNDCKIKIKSQSLKVNKICEKCHQEFMTNRSNQKFCSRKCVRKSNLDKAREAQKCLDWSTINKKSYREGKNHVGGGTTKWISYKDLKVQGSYELRTCIILDKMKELNLIRNWEYTNDRIPYVDVDGSNRTYLLDFKVFNHDNTFYYIETKGYSTETDECKWKSVREKGIRLDIWFNEEISKIEKELDI